MAGGTSSTADPGQRGGTPHRGQGDQHDRRSGRRRGRRGRRSSPRGTGTRGRRRSWAASRTADGWSRAWTRKRLTRARPSCAASRSRAAASSRAGAARRRRCPDAGRTPAPTLMPVPTITNSGPGDDVRAGGEPDHPADDGHEDEAADGLRRARCATRRPPAPGSRSRTSARPPGWTAGTDDVGTSPSTSPASSPSVLAAVTSAVRVSNSSRSSRPSAYASASTWWTTFRSWSEARSGAYSGRRGSRVKDAQIWPGSVIGGSLPRFAS